MKTMKKILAALLCMVMLLGVMPFSVSAESTEPSGTKNNPILVSTYDELYDALTNKFDGVYIKLLSTLSGDGIRVYYDAHIDLNGYNLNITFNIYGCDVELTGNGKLLAEPGIREGATLTINGAVRIDKWIGNFDSTVIINHPDAFVRRADVDDTVILKNGKLGDVNAYSNEIEHSGKFIMLGGTLGKFSGWDYSMRYIDAVIYGGKIDPAICTLGNDPDDKKDGTYLAYFRVDVSFLNEFYAVYGNEYKIIDDFDSMNKVYKDHGAFEVYAPYPIEQSPAMPYGKTSYYLDPIVAGSYIVSFKGNPVTNAMRSDGYKAIEKLEIYNSDDKLVKTIENDVSNGNGISYNLNNLPNGTYKIVETVALKNKNDRTVYDEVHTFHVDWKLALSVSGNISGVEGNTPVNVHLYKSGIGVPLEVITVNGNGSYKFDIAETGNYKILVSAFGYEQQSTDISVNGNTTKNFAMVKKTISGKMSYTSGVCIGKSVYVSFSGKVAEIPVANRNYQWQISSNGTSGWTNISGATTNPWTIPADSSYLGKYIRVVVTADGYDGKLISTASQITKQSNMHEVPVTPSLTKSDDLTAITISNYKSNQEYVLSTSSTPNWETDKKSNGNKFEGLVSGKTYYVHTRIAETNVLKAGYIVRSSSISLSPTVYLSGIELTAEKYIAESGEYVKITVNPVPGNATDFNGVIGSGWFCNSGLASAKLYQNTNGTALNPSAYYKSVYLKGAKAETVIVTVERTAGYNNIQRDTIKVEIAGSDGAFAFNASEVNVTPGTITVPRCGTATINLNSWQTPEKPIDTATWAHSSGTNLNGLTFEYLEGTNQVLVKASENCTLGTGYYKPTVNGTAQSTSLGVTVVESVIPAESISVSPANVSLRLGDIYYPSVSVSPNNTTDMVTWNVTSGYGVVSVDSSGKITALKTGTATVKATAGSQSATFTVTVSETPVEHSITVTNGTASASKLIAGMPVTITANQINGKIFSHWEVSGAVVADKNATETTFIMGNTEVTAEAIYNDCDCKCHTGSFFFKIILFFQKLFGQNKVCACGMKH